MSLFPPQEYRKTKNTHRIGLAADKPVATDVLEGTLYFSTDTFTLERSNGTIWESYMGSSIDYEEGTWTPTLVGDGGPSSGTTYTTQEGHYIRVGNLVTCWGAILLSNLGTIPGNILIGGFPFVSANITAGGFANGPIFWATMNTAFVLMQSSMIVNDTHAYLLGITTAGISMGAVTSQADFTNLSTLRVWLQYQVA